MKAQAPIIAIVGLCGVGKSEATQIIKDTFGYSVVYFGGQITGEVKNRGLTVGPDTERSVREELREKHGMAAIAILAEKEVREFLERDERVIIDGLYSYAELLHLQKAFTRQIYTIAVHSRKALRYQRMANRPIRPLTPDQVDQRDIHEVEALDKATPIALADFHVLNQADRSDLKSALLEALHEADASIFSMAS